MATTTESGDDRNGLHLVNRLDESRSPYVRGHMKNPVAWQVWDTTTLELAEKHNRLLFVSIGYAACHWCHVMERESFESPEVAQVLNEFFIPIKIDREERPDIDAIYMNYVQATTGSGGWPLNVFLTPDLEPVFGGTYWPGPNNSMTAVGTSMEETSGFLEILGKMKEVWATQEGKCRDSAKDIVRQLRDFAQEGVHGHGDHAGGKGSGDTLEIELLEEAYHHFERRYDKYNGGFASAPKFPTPVNLSFLLRLEQWPETVQDIVGAEECANAASMALHTLRKMARGGIRDQIGYGFSRYSVTKDWSLPHFEKMLYDQAQLLDVYLDAFLITHDAEMLGAVYDIVHYLTNAPLAAPNGGFYSAEDADSLPTKSDNEKREGAYYVWTLKEIQNILGPRDSDIFARFYGVKPDGNVAPLNDPHDELMNRNVLRIDTTPAQLAKDLSLPEPTITSSLKASRQKIRDHCAANRPRPALDDKIIVSWNGLAISALARTASALHAIEPSISARCLDAALSAASFIRREIYVPEDKKLYRVYSAGACGDTEALCDDYAFLIQGLLDLYEATFDDTHLQFADELQKLQLQRFRDSEHPAGFYTTPSPHPPDLLLRLKSGMDSAEPSGNNVSARNLYRLGSMLEDEGYNLAARNTVEAFEAEVQQFPFCFAGLLGSVVVGRLGVKGVVIVAGGAKNDAGADVEKDGAPAPAPVAAAAAATGGSGSREEDNDVKEILQKLRSTIAPDRTVVLVGGGEGKWVRERNKLLTHVGKSPAATAVVGDSNTTLEAEGGGGGGGKKKEVKTKVMLCEGGSCKEGGIELIA